MPLWPLKSLQQMVLASFITAVAPFCLAILSSVQTLGELVADNRNLTRIVVEASRLGREVQRDVLELERRAFQYAALAEDDLVALFERERGILLEKLQTLEQRLPPAGPELVGLRDALDGLSLGAAVGPGSGAAIASQAEVLARSFDEIGARERDMQGWLQRSINQLLGRQAEKADKIIDSLLFQVSLLVVTTLLLLLLFAHWINRPVRNLIREIDHLGTSGLSHRIEITGPDELQALGSKLEWLRQRLQETEQQKQQFLRHVSHELKTPLSNLREGTELLADEVSGHLSEQQREIVEIARRNGIELQRLIENLLEYNQLPTQQPEFDSVELAPLCRELLENYRLSIDKKALRLQIGGEVEHWMADRDKLRTALDNLLSNAVHYTPVGGEVEICWRVESGALVIEVANSGEPIPAEDSERVFEPFVQSRARRTGPIKGSGLGLSVARECIEAQGGTLSLAAHQTLATCFRLVCPAH